MVFVTNSLASGKRIVFDRVLASVPTLKLGSLYCM